MINKLSNYRGEEMPWHWLTEREIGLNENPGVVKKKKEGHSC